MKNIIGLLGVIMILTMSNCKRYDDTVLKVKVLNYADSLGVGSLQINVYKMKVKSVGMMSSKFKEVDKYVGYTNDKGESKIIIDNYNRKKYVYVVEVSPYSVGSKSFLFSRKRRQLEEYELNEAVLFWGSIIPLPDNLPYGP